MATTAVGIHGQGIALQSYQDKVQELTDVIVTTWFAFVVSPCAFWATSLTPRMRFRTFLSAFTHLDQFGGQVKMSTWLTAIVINAARMKLRRRSRQAQISLDETHGERNLLLAEMLPEHQPNPEEVCRRR
jgi:Sigma-70 region 2